VGGTKGIEVGEDLELKTHAKLFSEGVFDGIIFQGRAEKRINSNEACEDEEMRRGNTYKHSGAGIWK